VNYEPRSTSHHQGVSDYIDCGLLYKLARIDKVKPDFRSDGLEFGTVIHKVLAEFYQERLAGNKLPLKEIQANFEWYWRDAAEDISVTP
jgi:putative RecB family exonuclease